MIDRGQDLWPRAGFVTEGRICDRGRGRGKPILILPRPRPNSSNFDRGRGILGSIRIARPVFANNCFRTVVTEQVFPNNLWHDGYQIIWLHNNSKQTLNQPTQAFAVSATKGMLVYHAGVRTPGHETLGRKTLGRHRTKQDYTAWQIYSLKKKQDSTAWNIIFLFSIKIDLI